MKLRLLCAMDLYLHADEHAASFGSDDSFGMAISGPSENIFVATSDRREALKHEAILTCEITPNPRWSSLIHLQALANILEKPIVSIYPENTGFQYRYMFNRQIDPLISTPETADLIHIMWTVDGVLPHGMFTPNHFVLLKEGTKPDEPDYNQNQKEEAKPSKRNLKRQSKTLFDYNFKSLSKTSKTEDNMTEMTVDDKPDMNDHIVTETPLDTNKETSEQAAPEQTSKPTVTNKESLSQDDGHKTFEKNQPRNIVFPKRQFGMKKPTWRRFQKQFFDEFPWLHYSEASDSAFCYDCICANNRHLITSAKVEQRFISEGYTNWKEANQRFKNHQESECHKEAMLRLNINKECKDVGKVFSEKEASDQEKNRKSLIKILSDIRYLGRQGIPLRGSDDDANSNFNQLNLVRTEDDESFEVWLQKKTFTYDSPQIQNEVINIMSHEIVRGIANEVREAEFYSLLADETTDISNREQLVICLRWVDEKLLVHEEMVGLYQIDNTCAETIANSIKDVLLRLNISIQKCRGQTYDGASAMSGRKTGVQARIKNDQPKALFNNCHGHLINLACADSIKQSKVISDALDTALEITKLVKKSPNRDTKLEKIRRASVDETERPSPNIRMLCPTRWTVKADALDSILKNYDQLMELWDWSVDTLNDAKMKIRIRGVAAHMKKFDFFYGLSLGECLLRNADNLSATLQAKDISAAEGENVAMKTVQAISQMRTDNCFALFWEKITKNSKAVSVEEPCLPRRRRVPTRYELGNASTEYHEDVQSYYKQIYYISIDHLTNVITGRYDSPDFNLYMQNEQLLLKCVRKEDYKTELETVTDFYGNDLNKMNLKLQLESLAANFDYEGNAADIVLSDVIKYFSSMSVRERKWLKEVESLLKLVLVLPATNATSERSFSSLRRIKTYLRSTMKQERLNGLMVMHIHKERVDKIKLVDVAREFVSRSDVRFFKFGKF